MSTKKNTKPYMKSKMQIAWLTLLAKPEGVSFRELSRRLDVDRGYLAYMKQVAEVANQLDLDGDPPALADWDLVRVRYQEKVEGKVSRYVLDGRSNAKNKSTKAATEARLRQQLKAHEAERREAEEKAQAQVREKDRELHELRSQLQSMKSEQAREEILDQIEAETGQRTAVQVEKRHRA